MIDDDKPPLDEALLEHHGVKGMKWGVRRRFSVSSPESKAELKKLGIEVGTAVVVVGGLAVATAILAKGGSTPTSGISHVSGSNVVKNLSDNVWKTNVSGLSRQISEGHAAEDAWMKSIGLGAKNGVVDTAAFEKFLYKK